MTVRLYSRRLPWPQGAPSAFDVYAHRPQSFAALLEDPTGRGSHLLVAREGDSVHIPHGHGNGGVLDRWRQRLQPQAAGDGGGGVQCLFYAAYEAAGLLEALPPPQGGFPGPLLWLHFPGWSIRFLPEQEAVWLCSARSAADLDDLERMLRSACAYQENGWQGIAGDIGATAGADYMRAVARVKAYIRAGDIFQANIARFWQTPFAGEVLPLYARLRRVNSAPFAALVRITGEGEPLTILSASPERLFRVTADGWVETRPIAGTRRRGQGARDRALETELLLSAKERAEHIMLVDLERNDLGRVCRPGTVAVNERMVVERYATVQHIVSNVRGRLRPGMDVVDVFAAMFPGGTITGCPKIRCMQIIQELEGRARGPYTGGVGYIAWDGSADMNILIRTFWHHRDALHWAAGAGIVADSDPKRELEETEHKAAGLLRALRPGRP